MSDDNGSSIVLDIQFEDGSVQQGFIRMASLGQKTAKQVGDNFSKVKFIDFDAVRKDAGSMVEDLVGGLSKVHIAVAALALGFIAVKKAFEFALDGERINAVNAQFNTLAKQAGIAGDAMKEGLEKAADGLIDVDHLLQTANSQIINLGANAGRLPEVLELARKVTNALGGDLQARFEGISSAIESGNARALKAQGIYLDSDEALKKMANSLGLNVAELNLAQRQQAILNATLEQGNNKYKDVPTSIQPATENVQRLKVAIGQLVDQIAVAAANSGAFKNLTDLFGQFAKPTVENKNGIATQIAGLVAERLKITAKLEDLKSSLAKSGLSQGQSFLGGDIEIYEAKLKKLNAAINGSGAVVLTNTAEMVSAAKKESSAAESSAIAVGNSVKAKLTVQQEAAKQLRRLAIEEANNQGALSANANEAAKTSLISSESDKRIALIKSYNERKLLVEQDAATKERELRLQRTSDAIGTDSEYQAKLIQLHTATKDELAKIELQKAQANDGYNLTLEENSSSTESILDNFSNMFKGGQEAAKDFAKSSEKSFKDFGKAAFNTLGVGIANSFAAFGNALATGKDAGQAFLDSMLGVFGDLCIQMGTMMILQGIGISSNIFTFAAGAPLIAAGAALATFGGVLKGVSGGAGGGSSSGASETGGGVSSLPSSQTQEVISPDSIERKKPDTTIQLNIQGDVLDSDETGMRITQILQRSFDMNGVRVVGGAY